MRKLAALLAVAALAVLLWQRHRSAPERSPAQGAPVVSPEPSATDARSADVPETEAPEPWVLGRVRTEEGVPIEGAEVRAVLPDGPAAKTGADGAY